MKPRPKLRTKTKDGSVKSAEILRLLMRHIWTIFEQWKLIFLVQVASMSQSHSVKTNVSHHLLALQNHLMEHQPQVDHHIQLLLELLRPPGKILSKSKHWCDRPYISNFILIQYFLALFDRISSIFEVFNIKILYCLKIFFNFEILGDDTCPTWRTKTSAEPY